MLPDGFVPMATGGELPMRFEPDGRLRVQVRSGEHELTVRACHVAADAIAVPQGEGAWADEEVWSYGSNDRLRITALEGAPPIDPIQAGVPAIGAACLRFACSAERPSRSPSAAAGSAAPTRIACR